MRGIFFRTDISEVVIFLAFQKKVSNSVGKRVMKLVERLKLVERRHERPRLQY